MALVLQPSPARTRDRFAIVVARWNQAVTSKLLDGATGTFAAAGIADHLVHVAWVPGAWELPVVAKRFAATGKYAAVICLGAVVRGETSHDQHINRAVTLAMSDIALAYDLPVLLGLLTCNTLEQAQDRAGGAHGNKGAECAEAALAMVGLLRAIGADLE